MFVRVRVRVCVIRNRFQGKPIGVQHVDQEAYFKERYVRARALGYGKQCGIAAWSGIAQW